MKKLMIMAILAVAAFAASAADINDVKALDPKTSTFEEYMAALDIVKADTNYLRSIRTADKYRLTSAHKAPFADRLVGTIDAALAEKYSASRRDGCFYRSPFWPGAFHSKYPTAAKAIIETYGLDTRLPNVCAIYNEHALQGVLTPRSLCTGIGVDERVRILGDLLSVSPEGHCYAGLHLLMALKTRLQQDAAREIKTRLRRKGLSFVTKNGVNPCEAYLTRLNTALDAPNFEGLNQWLEDLGYTARIDATKLMSAQGLEKLKTQVFYGERYPTLPVRATLMVGLGHEGYNKFIKEYNGDK